MDVRSEIEMNCKDNRRQCIKQVDKYWNDRLSYLAQSDRLDDAEALYSEFNIDGENLIYEAFDRNEDILFLENLNDL